MRSPLSCRTRIAQKSTHVSCRRPGSYDGESEVRLESVPAFFEFDCAACGEHHAVNLKRPKRQTEPCQSNPKPRSAEVPTDRGERGTSYNTPAETSRLAFSCGGTTGNSAHASYRGSCGSSVGPS